MSKKKSIFISCEEAVLICDKIQYKEASFWDKLKLNLHLIYCRACRKYSKNNVKLTKLTKSDDVECLSQVEKETMKASFTKELEKHY